MRRRAAITFVLTVAACGLAAVDAAAAGPFRPCARASPLLCARLTVPLDRSGAVPGTVNLHAERLRARGRRDGALFALAGGPGEAATPYVFDWAFTFNAALRNRDLVVFDQRGTGLSGALRCRGLFVPVTRTPLEQAQAAERCAQSLGPRRAFYTTRDSVDDIDAVRRAVGVDKITLFGVSYGTKVALGYAAKYPQHVERLVLDSVVEPTGPGAFGEESLAAVPRVLRTLCLRGCEDITTDVLGDLTAVLASMRGGLLYGPLVGIDGRRQRARIGRLRLMSLLFAGDFDPTLRAELPAALRAAREGDRAPLLRLALRSERGAGPTPASLLSDALYAATVCEEGPLPWDRATPVGARAGAAEATVRTLPPASLGPFDRTSVLFGSAPFQLCSRWPTTPAAPRLPDGPFPAVPTLVLSGEDDLRTPLESARRIAARIPGATLVSVPDMGHSVLNGFPRRCGVRAADDFFAGRAVRPCVPRRRTFPTLPRIPRSLTQVDPEPHVGGRPGRTITAVGLTLADALDQLLGASLLAGFEQDVLRVAGLRAGYVRAGAERVELHGVVYVPGVRVRGQITFSDRPHGVFRITGRSAARGTLVFRRDGSVTGRLGGRRVRVASAGRAARHTTQLARGAPTRVLARLRRWPPPTPQHAPGSFRLPIATGQE
jgi:pimeloyl-ACP methyl ester carboxylesterase